MSRGRRSKKTGKKGSPNRFRECVRYSQSFMSSKVTSKAFINLTHKFSGASCDDEDFGVTENSVRRLNWQKGRQDWSRPSKTQAEIDKVTVDSITEVYGRMRKHGWAILLDCTDVLHPKCRFTREQMTYIEKCK